MSVTAAQPQDKSSTTNAPVPPPPQSGTETPVFAQLEPSEPTVFNVQPQDSGMEIIVSAPRTEPGTVKIASVLQDFSELNVFHAHHQDSGTTLQVNVYAQKRESGTDKAVLVHQDFSVQTVSAARLKNIGMKRPKFVSVKLH